MIGDTLIPVETAILGLTMANDFVVSVEDRGSYVTIKTMRLESYLSTWKKKKEASVHVVVRDGQRYVSKRAIDSALNEIGALGAE